MRLRLTELAEVVLGLIMPMIRERTSVYKLSCLSLLGNLGLVDFRNYDQNGRSFIHAAIKGGDPESVRFIVAILLKGGLDPRHFRASIGGMSILHHVAFIHNNDAFRGVTELLEDTGYPLSVWNDDSHKLELCSFITADITELLLSKGFNITNPYYDMHQRLEDQKEAGHESAQRIGQLRSLISAKAKALDNRLEPFGDTRRPLNGDIGLFSTVRLLK